MAREVEWNVKQVSSGGYRFLDEVYRGRDVSERK